MLDLCQTAEEKSVFGELQNKIGKEFVSLSVEEAISRGEPSRGGIIFFWHWGAEADWSFIKKWCIAHEDYNALWFDEDYAKKSIWGGVIAPPLYLISVNDGLEATYDYLTYFFENREKLPKYERSIEAETEWEFFEPVRPGERIESKHWISDVFWKRGKESRLLFICCETILTKQKGVVVAKNKTSDIHVFRK